MVEPCKFSIITFGCKINQYEEELMKEQLLNAGFVLKRVEEADVVIFNSCAVTEEALRKLFQKIRHVRRFNPHSKVVVTGCAVQTDLNRFEHFKVDAIVSLEKKKKIVPVVQEVLHGRSEIFDVNRTFWRNEELGEKISADSWEKTRAFVKVEDGCDRACSYCAIRIARGSAIRSKPVSLVAEEVTHLVEKGFREIVLVGVNLGRYGKERGGSLVDLLKVLINVEGEFRIRLSSLNPEDIDDDLISILATPKLCPHLHISLQSGSDSVLSRMNRSYQTADFFKIVEKLRKIDPLFSVSTDIIVGFPGETEEEFSKTLLLLERFDFSRVHIFRFSPRKGTPAFRMNGQIDGTTKKRRARFLRAIAHQSTERYLRRHIGRKRTVLVEEEDGLSWGYDEYYIKCTLPTKDSGFIEATARTLKSKGEELYLDCGILFERKVG
ncbi:MAG: tRNA (N(6)-L-threonylcarbamoyladenosine(37)-C(2))-methylthiotransferase MtaB [Thermotogae bacterium]|nr:MAG: tRNA (N(6)-L-threonylcarbamoyladenosine(37)-C(2))-methylthiotransferase MtaB [Thermotogota bacterium]